MKIVAAIVIVSFVHLVFLIYGNVAHQGSNVRKPLLDGVNIEKLSGRQLQKFLEAEDEKLIGEIDIWAGKQALKMLRRQRRKRVPPVVVAGLWIAGRYVLKSVIRNTLPKITKHYAKKQLTQITKQYFKRGNYNKALKDFERFRPTNVKLIKDKGGRVVGRTGQILDGKASITARRFSTYPTKPGRPTLEIYKKTKDGVKVYRKLRYESRKSYLKNKVNYKYREPVKKIKRIGGRRSWRGGRRSLRSGRRGGRRSLRSGRRGGRRSLRSRRRGGRRSLRSGRRGGRRSLRSRRRGGRRSLRSRRRRGRRSSRSRRRGGRRSLRSRRRGGRRSLRSRRRGGRRSLRSGRRGGRRSLRSRRGSGRRSYGSRQRGGRRSSRRSGRSRSSGRWG